MNGGRAAAAASSGFGARAHLVPGGSLFCSEIPCERTAVTRVHTHARHTLQAWPAMPSSAMCCYCYSSRARTLTLRGTQPHLHRGAPWSKPKSLRLRSLPAAASYVWSFIQLRNPNSSPPPSPADIGYKQHKSPRRDGTSHRGEVGQTSGGFSSGGGRACDTQRGAEDAAVAKGQRVRRFSRHGEDSSRPLLELAAWAAGGLLLRHGAAE